MYIIFDNYTTPVFDCQCFFRYFFTFYSNARQNIKKRLKSKKQTPKRGLLLSDYDRMSVIDLSLFGDQSD